MVIKIFVEVDLLLFVISLLLYDMGSFNIKMDLKQTLYKDTCFMNMADYLIILDTSFRNRLGTDYFKRTFKSISYESVAIEWE